MWVTPPFGSVCSGGLPLPFIPGCELVEVAEEAAPAGRSAADGAGTVEPTSELSRRRLPRPS